MPLHTNTTALFDHITRKIASEQQSLAALLRGEKAINDHLLRVDTVQSVQSEVRAAWQQGCDDMADGILARLVVQTTAQCVQGLPPAQRNRLQQRFGGVVE